MGRSDQRLDVHYRLACGPGEDPAVKARSIALEQTVELPDGCYPAALEDRVVGRVERVGAAVDGRTPVTISYALETVGDDPSQLLNLLFGNVSMQAGIRIESVDWPPALWRRWPGPRFGVEGLRRVCGVPRGPLSCTALKPMGLDAEALARRAYGFARAGVDLVKDDHGIADQPMAPFDERVARCLEAVGRANDETGGRALYLPNVTGPPGVLGARARRLASLGCRAVLTSPLVAGVDSIAWLAREFDLAVMAHPALAGAFFHADHGLDAGLLLGDLFRIVGADAVIFPNVGGRFPFDQARCDRIVSRLRTPLGPIRPAFPVPAGGIRADRVQEWLDRYGDDTILLIGGSLYAQPDPPDAARTFTTLLRARR